MNSKYSKENIAEIAQRGGSVAKTSKGQLKFILNNFSYWPKMKIGYRDEGYFNRERERKSDPEAKRAQNDKSFRTKWLRRLGAEEKRLRSPKLDTLEDISAAGASYGTRKNRLCEIARLKRFVLPEYKLAEFPKVTAGVLVSSFDPKFARKMGVTGINMSGYEAVLEPCREASYGIHSQHTPSYQKNNRWTGFERATHRNYVRSFGLIDKENNKKLNYIFHKTKFELVLPDNHHWSEDANGLKVVCGPDDYHPTASELCCKNSIQLIIEKIQQNAARRRELSAQKLAEEAELKGVTVCAADSLRAGNCRAGTESFIQRHQLNIKKHYGALELLGIANGDSQRVRLCLRSAAERIKKEMERGYSILAEHEFV